MNMKALFESRTYPHDFKFSLLWFIDTSGHGLPCHTDYPELAHDRKESDCWRLIFETLRNEYEQ